MPETATRSLLPSIIGKHAPLGLVLCWVPAAGCLWGGTPCCKCLAPNDGGIETPLPTAGLPSASPACLPTLCSPFCSPPQAAFCELIGTAAGYGYFKWLIADVDRYQPGDVIPVREAGAHWWRADAQTNGVPLGGRRT